MGEQNLLLVQAQTEAGILAQESYLAGVWQVHTKSKNVEAAERMRDQAVQGVIFSIKYMLAGGLSALGAGIDSAKRAINFFADRIVGSEVFDTVSAETTKQLKECRESTQKMLAALKHIRELSDEQTAALTTSLPRHDGVKALDENRLFHESTSGGFRRLEACYQIDLEQLMDTELAIAVRHAELVLRDMKNALNAKIGAEASGHFNHLRNLTTNPMGYIRVAIQDSDWGGDHFSSTMAYVANREGQLQELETVRHGLNRTGFNLLELRKHLPKAYAYFLALEEDHPDFLQWTLVRDRLACQQRLDRIDRLLADEFEPDPRAMLNRKRILNRAMMTMNVADKQGRIFQMQGADKLMVWDYDGALESFYQAAEWDPRIMNLNNLQELRKALAWQKTVEAGIEAASHLGNLGVHIAMFEFLGRRVGSALPTMTTRTARASREVAAGEAAASEAAALEASTWRAWLTKPLPGSGFADFVWRQVNPFADLINAGVVQNEWRAIARASAGLGTITSLMVVQQDIIRRGILEGYFGVDAVWADFLANVLVNSSQAEMKSGRSLLTELAGNLWRLRLRLKPAVVDAQTHANRHQARSSVGDFWTYFAWCKQNKEQREQVRGRDLENAGDAQIRTETEGLANSQRNLETTLEPLTIERLVERYEEFFGGPDASKPGEWRRLQKIREFFTGVNWIGEVMELGMKKDDPINAKVDNLRREILSSAQADFIKSTFGKKYADDIVSALYVGSAGDRHSQGYKKTASDIDFTLLVRKDLPEATRHQLRQDFLVFFHKYCGHKELEGFDMSIMVDPIPEFFPTGESVSDFLAAVHDPAQRALLAQGVKSTIEQLIRNASDGERYLDRGNLFRHNLCVRLGGFLKELKTKNDPETVELVNAPMSKYDQLYGKVPLEPWMAFDAIIGNLGFIHQHAPKNPNNMIDYHKVVGSKYAIRGPLFALLLMSPRGRQELQSLTRAEVNRKGWEGAERAMVEVAKKILHEPGGQGQLDLPTTLRIPGQKHPVPMDAAAWTALFDQMIARKEGKPLHEVFGVPKGDNAALNDAVVTNIGRTEAFFHAALRKAIMVQATALKDLANAAKEARVERDLARQEVIELKMKEIILSQAAVWNRMSRDQQNQVLKQLPPEADWWLAIAEVERLNETAGRKAPTERLPEQVVLDFEALVNWTPYMHFQEELDEADQRRLQTLRSRAGEDPVSYILNSQARSANR
jgi:hypothetical protein